MINTVAQGVLGRNRSLSVDGLLRSARIWAMGVGKIFSRGGTRGFFH